MAFRASSGVAAIARISRRVETSHLNNPPHKRGQRHVDLIRFLAPFLESQEGLKLPHRMQTSQKLLFLLESQEGLKPLFFM